MRVHLSPSVLHELAMSRLRCAGLTVYGHVPPDVSILGPEPNFEQPSCHCCRNEQVIELPPFLVVPIAEVPSVDVPWDVWKGDRGHDAYWVGGALLTHFHHQRPESNFRDATRREAVCLMAQLQRLGSVRVWDGHTEQRPVVEACFWGPGRLSLHRTGPNFFMFPGLNHHRLWIPRNRVPYCSSTRDLTAPRNR